MMEELSQIHHHAENDEASQTLENNAYVNLFENANELDVEVEDDNNGSAEATAETSNASETIVAENFLGTAPSSSTSAPVVVPEAEGCATDELRQRLLALLECPVCFNYMVPPILLCESGHSVCDKCRPFLSKCPICRKVFLKTRNISLEKISVEMNFPCRYQGCSDVRSVEHLENHVSVGVYPSLYACPFTHFTHCYWQGNLEDIKNHFEIEHAERIFYDIHTHDWLVNLAVRDLKIIFALGEIFLYKLKLDTLNSRFYVQVFYIGPTDNHRNFVYTVCLSSKLCNRKVTFQNTVLPLVDLEQPSSYMFGNCIIFEYAVVSKMSVKGDIRCFLKLTRVEAL